MTTLAIQRLIDGSGSEPRQRVSVRISGAEIEAVEPADVDAGDMIRLDREDVTVLPGLIDAHAHMALVHMGQESASAAVIAGRIFQNCARAIDEGFTVVRDLGGADGGLADAIEQGLVRGPTVLPSGPVLCQRGGHGDFSPCFGVAAQTFIPGLLDPSMIVDGADSARTGAREALKRGATQLKIILNGGFYSSTPLERGFLSHSEVAAITEEAARAGTYATAHVHSLASLEMAVAAGVGCVEHGTFIGREGAQLLADAGVPFVPTLSAVAMLKELGPAWGISENSIERARRALDESIAALHASRACGVTIGLGSDLVGADQKGRAQEIVLRAELESPMDALVSATSGNAAVLRRSHDLGCIAPGYRADLIAVRGDPLADPALLLDERNILFVMKAGQVEKNILDAG